MHTPDPILLQEVTTAVERLDKNRIVFRKSTGWLMAALVVSSLGGLAYGGAHFFTRELQIDRMRTGLNETQEVLRRLNLKNQALERRIVELETQVENLQGR